MIFSWLLNTLYTLTPYLDFPAPPQDWGILGPFLHVVIASLSSHAQLLSVLSRLISPPPRTDGHSPHWDGHERRGVFSPRKWGAIAFSPRNVSSTPWSKHCCYKLFLGRSRAPFLSTLLGKVGTIVTHEDFPYQQ